MEHHSFMDKIGAHLIFPQYLEDMVLLVGLGASLGPDQVTYLILLLLWSVMGGSLELLYASWGAI